MRSFLSAGGSCSVYIYETEESERILCFSRARQCHWGQQSELRVVCSVSVQILPRPQGLACVVVSTCDMWINTDGAFAMYLVILTCAL